MISGPSGVGKGTVCNLLRERHPEVFYSISMTTRAPRPGEIEREAYHFVTDEHFLRLAEAGELLEYAVVHGRDHYGTPRQPVLDALAEGRTVVLEIDLHRRAVLVRDLTAGREAWEGFDQLMVATGATPARPPLPGIDAAGIHGVQTLDDGLALRAVLERDRPGRAVVVGAGYIGLELAEALDTFLAHLTDPDRLADLVAHKFIGDPFARQRLLEEANVAKRLRLLITLLTQALA